MSSRAFIAAVGLFSALLSSCVVEPAMMWRKFGSDPVTLTNGGFSENDAVSRGATCDQNPPIVGYAAVPSK